MDKTKSGYEGGCLCGAVRYRVDGPLRPVVECYCRQCQKTSGNYVAATQAEVADLTVSGEASLTWFRSSEFARRAFCSECGSNLFWHRDDDPRLSIMAGTLDQPTGLKISAAIHGESAADFHVHAPEIPQIEQADLKNPVWRED